MGKISDYSDVVCGPFGSAITDKDYVEVGIPLLRITNITKEGALDYSDVKCIADDLSENLKSTQVYEGDIVVSQRGTLGQCAIIDNTYKKCNMSANLIGIKNIRQMSPQFIRNYIHSPIGIKFLERAQSGQVQGKINTSDIAFMPIPKVKNEEALNSLMEDAYGKYQSKLIQADELLSGVDGYVLNVLGLAMPQFTDRLSNAVTLKNIKQDGTLSADYYHPQRMATVKMLLDNNQIISEKLVAVIDFHRDTVSADNNEMRYIGLASVQSNTGELIDIEEEAEGQAFSYETGDVLYGRLRPYLNKVFVAETDGICSTEFHVMRIKENRLLSDYLSVIMRSQIIVSQTKHMMTGNTHPRIANAEVENLLIPIPTKEVQRQIAEEAVRCRTLARQLRDEAENAWKAAKAQFEKALLGEV